MSMNVDEILGRKDHWILDAKGDPVACDLMTWAKFFEDRSKKKLAGTDVGPYYVSTVFLGIDHGWHDGDPPVLWETMIFKADAKACGGFRAVDPSDPESEYQERYTSRAEALAGHERAVVHARRAIARVVSTEASP